MSKLKDHVNLVVDSNGLYLISRSLEFFRDESDMIPDEEYDRIVSLIKYCEFLYFKNFKEN